MNAQYLRLTWLVGLLVAGCATTPRLENAGPTAPAYWALDATPLDRSAAELEVATDEHLAFAKALRAKITSVTGPRTIENTLIPYNEMLMHLDAAEAENGLLARVHPDARVRDVGEAGEQAVAALMTELSLDRELFDAVAAVDVSGADAATQFFVEKELRDFRRSGVDRSDAVRAQVKAVRDEIVKLGLDFGRNTRDDRRVIMLESVADLDGMPQDWIEGHAPGDDGLIRVSTDYPDYIPFITYARNADARLQLYKAFKDRGYPKNIDVLQSLLTKRHELATLLGYAHWADYITEDKMIGSAANAQSFIDKIAEACRAAVDRDYAILLERKRQDVPDAKEVADWEKSYYKELVKSERYAFESQSVRPYFNFKDVRQGLFDLTGKLFGVRYEQVHGLKLWHPEVTAWDVFDGKERLGRFYLDLHPRDNKYKHAAQFGYRTGIAGVRLPQAALVCNFPNPSDSPDGVALMEHAQVVTFFHEFGHLLHTIFAGHLRWMGNSGINTERDFVEAPSQMLEEWCWDVDTLQVFARHYQTGAPIPADLVRRMKSAADFGKGLDTAHQMFYASVSLNYYDRDPATLDTTEKLIELQSKYSPFRYIDGTHFQCNFGHLDGYSAIYYTYMWSKVIAKDMFTRFEREGRFNVKTARAYRHRVLEPGGSKKAAELVASFLGRPYAFDAFEAWLNRSS
ncbi:MAG: M3 family metallopeptidase [Phycisphaerae bacterium]